MNGSRQAAQYPRQTVSVSRLLFLALFFLGGILLGQVLAGKVPDGTGDELTRYLTDYVYLYGQTAPEGRAFWETVVIYFRYPLLAVFLGFTSVGVVLLPVVAVAFGFFLSFSVSCFTAAFGGEGVLLALAVSGLRCALTLPCFFLLAVPSWQTSWALAGLSLGPGGLRPGVVAAGRPRGCSAAGRRVCRSCSFSGAASSGIGAGAVIKQSGKEGAAWLPIPLLNTGLT